MRRVDCVRVADKPGVERRHATTVPWSAEFAGVLRSQGYVIRRLEYEVDDEADAVARPAASAGP